MSHGTISAKMLENMIQNEKIDTIKPHRLENYIQTHFKNYDINVNRV